MWSSRWARLPVQSNRSDGRETLPGTHRARAISISDGVNSRSTISICLGWMQSFPPKPSYARFTSAVSQSGSSSMVVILSSKECRPPVRSETRWSGVDECTLDTAAELERSVIRRTGAGRVWEETVAHGFGRSHYHLGLHRDDRANGSGARERRPREESRMASQGEKKAYVDEMVRKRGYTLDYRKVMAA
jgi:hypothetical protein